MTELIRKEGAEWLEIGNPLVCGGCGRHVPVYQVFYTAATDSLEHRSGSDGTTPVLVVESMKLDGDYCKRCILKGEIHGLKIVASSIKGADPKWLNLKKQK